VAFIYVIYCQKQLSPLLFSILSSFRAIKYLRWDSKPGYFRCYDLWFCNLIGIKILALALFFCHFLLLRYRKIFIGSRTQVFSLEFWSLFLYYRIRNKQLQSWGCSIVFIFRPAELSSQGLERRTAVEVIVAIVPVISSLQQIWSSRCFFVVLSFRDAVIISYRDSNPAYFFKLWPLFL
jgi:hypothetical protein